MKSSVKKSCELFILIQSRHGTFEISCRVMIPDEDMQMILLGILNILVFFVRALCFLGIFGNYDGCLSVQRADGVFPG